MHCVYSCKIYTNWKVIIRKVVYLLKLEEGKKEREEEERKEREEKSEEGKTGEGGSAASFCLVSNCAMPPT